MRLRKLFEDMMKGDFGNSNRNKGMGRRYIPDTLQVPRSKIEELNKLTGDPKKRHIRILQKPDATGEIAEIRLAVSPLLKIALDESKRGRTSRQTLMYQNKLLKRFNEIFSGGQLQMFKGALKKSIDNQQIINHPIYGDMFISNLEILPLAK